MNTPYKEPVFGRFWAFLWILVLLAVAYSTLGCGGKSLTGPSEPETREVRHSSRIPVIGGSPEQEHFVNDAWKQLQEALAASGMRQADPGEAWGLSVRIEASGSRPWLLARPEEPFSVLGDRVIILPAGFMESNHARATVAHEAAHAWCLETMGHYCLVTGSSTAADHVYRLPNGQELWTDVVWDGGRP